MSDSNEDDAFVSADESSGIQESKTNPKSAKHGEDETKNATTTSKETNQPKTKGKGKAKNRKQKGKSTGGQKDYNKELKNGSSNDKSVCPKNVHKDEDKTESRGEAEKKNYSVTDGADLSNQADEKPDTSQQKSFVPKSKMEIKSDHGENEKSDESPIKRDTEVSTKITTSPGEEKMSRTVEDSDDLRVETNADENSTKGQESSGWGWGWGTTLLKTATDSVSVLSQQVEKMKLVQASEPNKDSSKETDSKTTQEPSIEGNTAESSGWFSSISSLVQNTVSEGMGVLETIGTGSLDVMEKIGKKTYSVITEHDPGFRKARQFLGKTGNKPNLSVMLREARDEANIRLEREKEISESHLCHFEYLFDEYQGLSHLEALEIVSNQSEKRVQALLHAMSDETLEEIKPHLLAIKEIFEMIDDDDNDNEGNDDKEEREQNFISQITNQISKLDLGTSSEKLGEAQQKSCQWISKFYEDKNINEPKEIHKMAIQFLAELTSRSVEQFHKVGELTLLKKDSQISFNERSLILSRLTQVICAEINRLSAKYAQCLNSLSENTDTSDVVNPLVTNIYLEASNSSTYVQDAFQLLLPVFQQSTIQNSELLQSS